MMAVILMESFEKPQKMQVVDAAREAALITGYNEHTLRKYRVKFSNKGRAGGIEKRQVQEILCVPQ